MPRRKSLTRRFLHHLLLLSLARAILTVLGRGRAWDEWNERGVDPEPEPAQPRRFKCRFVQALSFSALFFAGLALSAGAGNGVRSLLEEDAAAPSAAQGASGATGSRWQASSRANSHTGSITGAPGAAYWQMRSACSSEGYIHVRRVPVLHQPPAL